MIKVKGHRRGRSMVKAYMREGQEHRTLRRVHVLLGRINPKRHARTREGLLDIQSEVQASIGPRKIKRGGYGPNYQYRRNFGMF